MTDRSMATRQEKGSGGHFRLPMAVTALGLLGLLAMTSDTWLMPPRNHRRGSAREIQHGAKGRRVIAVTFDAGGEAEGCAQLLQNLARVKRRCTFFITGHWAMEHPELVRQIHRQGHEIGNHTWSHRDLTLLSDDEVRLEITKAEQVLTALTGKTPRPLWRAPFGARDERVLRLAAQLGYTSIYWSIDSLDSVGEPKSAAFLWEHVTTRSDAALDGAIVLMHVGEPATAEAVPAIMATLRQRRLSAVTISQLTESSWLKLRP
jgi:peptidoglycan/xylan/chitin deacetylase (PgdA/CDA1 family)